MRTVDTMDWQQTASRGCVLPSSARQGRRAKEPSNWRWAYAVFFLCLVTPVAASAQTLTTLVSFDGYGSPYFVSLAQGLDGNFYGTTSGTVFECLVRN